MGNGQWPRTLLPNLFKTSDQAREDSGDIVDLLGDDFVVLNSQVLQVYSELELGLELEQRSASDLQEAKVIGPATATVPLSNVARDRDAAPAQLRCQPETLVL